MIRSIVEERSKNIAVMDVFSKLAQSRILFIDDDITDELANGIVSQLLYLDSLNNEEISIYINSHGGAIYSMLAIIDVMEIVKSPIKTVCVGKAMSAAAVILLCGNKRCATRNSTIMLHEGTSGYWDRFSQAEVQYDEFRRVNNIVMDFIIEGTKIENPKEWLEKDRYLTSKQALELGVIDEILSRKE